MSALGHYLEEEGLATVCISLIREHSAALSPPRTLWVPFMLGRPLGVPNDAQFQRKVLLAALGLLDADAGPGLIEDFPDDAPYADLGEQPEALHCPVSFPRLKSTGTLAERLADEIAQLQAWHEVATRQSGGNTLGLTGLAPARIGQYLLSWLGETPQAPYKAGLATAPALKFATDELKAFYYEAKSAQPGRRTPEEVQNWFWLDTAAGQLFEQLQGVAGRSAEPGMKTLANLTLVPRAMAAALKARASA